MWIINLIIIKSYYICSIKAKRHIKKGLSPAAMEKKLNLQEEKLKLQARQLVSYKQRIKNLTSDKKALTHEVAAHKWNHALAKGENTRLKGDLKDARKEIADLKEALRVAGMPKNSSNSSRPPSSDFYRPRRSKRYSLRTQNGRKPGGQPGHPGSTLRFCADPPDQIITHAMAVCAACGKDLSSVSGTEEQTHQVVDIAIPKRVIINHISFTKRCTCGHCNTAPFPLGAEGPVNYGNNIRGLVANLSARQYMPYKRTVEFLEDVFGIPMSQGTVTNLLAQFEKSATSWYNDIQQKILKAPVVGADETSAKVNGAKNWFHTYQTPQLTFIGFHPSRGKKAQEYFYPHGLPYSILVTDCLAMQLSTPAAAHQVCLAHILRELHAFEEIHPEERWPTDMKELLMKALELGRTTHGIKEVKVIEKEFARLLKSNQSHAPGKIPAFWKRMNTHRDKVFTFLHHQGVPGDNNGSERAIRCVKVKQKVSGQFKTPTGAHRYAISRSIIDTLIKQHKNVHQQLAKIASLAPG